MFDKLSLIEERYEELSKKVSDPDIIADSQNFAKLCKEQSDIAPIVEKFREYKSAKQAIAEGEEILSDPDMDKEMKELKKEVKENREVKNPKYINCAIFSVNPEDKLTEEEQELIISILFEGAETDDEELNRFVGLFIEDYFGGNAEACDNAYEVEAEYVAFNFDDSRDHDYSEDDLVLIREELNKIVGREAFEDYEGAGTDDSVEY